LSKPAGQDFGDSIFIAVAMVATLSSLSASDWTNALLCSMTIGFSFSVVTVGTPVLPQYFRESASAKARQNVQLFLGGVFDFVDRHSFGRRRRCAMST